MYNMHKYIFYNKNRTNNVFTPLGGDNRTERLCWVKSHIKFHDKILAGVYLLGEKHFHPVSKFHLKEKINNKEKRQYIFLLVVYKKSSYSVTIRRKVTRGEHPCFEITFTFCSLYTSHQNLSHVCFHIWHFVCLQHRFNLFDFLGRGFHLGIQGRGHCLYYLGDRDSHGVIFFHVIFFFLCLQFFIFIDGSQRIHDRQHFLLKSRKIQRLVWLVLPWKPAVPL